jgi:hypothetical protein
MVWTDDAAGRVVKDMRRNPCGFQRSREQNTSFEVLEIFKKSSGTTHRSPAFYFYVQPNSDLHDISAFLFEIDGAEERAAGTYRGPRFLFEKVTSTTWQTRLLFLRFLRLRSSWVKGLVIWRCLCGEEEGGTDIETEERHFWKRRRGGHMDSNRFSSGKNKRKKCFVEKKLTIIGDGLYMC